MTAEHDLTGVRLDDRYLLTHLMGQGGMGQVYAGVHEFLDRPVAIKVLLPRFAVEAKYRERFLREAKAASKVHHLNVVEILDYGETPNDSVYFVMEYLDGLDLKALLRQTGPLPWPRARGLLLQILAALEAAHHQRIIHRDIKPANCFLISTPDHPELVKLLDFGIAKVVVEPGDASNSLADSLTATGEVFGTVKYMSPEVATGVTDEPRSDMYSVGILAYEMLTGVVPFSGPFAFQIINRHVNEPPRPPSQLVPDLPPAAEAFILRALAKRPQNRFGSMRQMRRALEVIPASSSGVYAEVPTAGLGDSVHPAPPAGITVRMHEAQPGRVPEIAVTVVQDGYVPRPPESSRTNAGSWRLAAGLVVGIGSAGLLAFGAQTWSETDTDRTTPAARIAGVGASAASASSPTDHDAERGERPSIEPPPEANSKSSGEPESEAARPTPSPSTKSPTSPASTRTRRSKSRSGKPLTDAKVRSRLARGIGARCLDGGGGGSVTVDVVVGSDGSVLNKRVTGASGSQESCVLEQVARARFPAGDTRRVTIRAKPP